MGGPPGQKALPPDPNAPDYRTRLQALRDGIENQIKKLKETAPKTTRVGVIVFNDQVSWPIYLCCIDYVVMILCR